MIKTGDSQNKILIRTIAVACFFLAGFLFATQNKISYAQINSADAIAIRILPNQDHLSALAWYKKQGFTGSPQSLTVDGYEAVRDGRTVYVNVANIISGQTNNTLYTNIYLISYNQNAEKETVDIFSQILRHWKFNSNIPTAGHCRKDATVACIEDDECKLGDFCDSLKARVTRDTKRLADITSIKSIMASFRQKKGYYPKLNAGTYLSQRSLSVWPSWQTELSKEVGANIPADPVNKIGVCSGFDTSTCWNDTTKTFVTNLPALPSGSLLYYYSSINNGANYDICATFESGAIFSGTAVCALAVCLDFDGDGYGNPPSSACTLHPTQQDCNDSDPNINVPSAENCNDGIDNDCDGFIDCADSNCSSNSACTAISGCNNNTFCDPGEDCNTCPSDCGACPTTCPDGVCDASCNECSTCYDTNGTAASHNPNVDCYCGDGIICNLRGEECDNGSLNGTPGNHCSATCKTLTSNCVDEDHDGYDTCDVGAFGGDTHPIDCNDTDPNVYPGAPELCDNIDQNCDINHLVADTLGEESCRFACQANGHLWVNNGLPNSNCCGNNPGETSVQANEKTPINYCNDNIDNDCDGKIDGQDTDCMACNAGNSTNESFWFMVGQSDCNQCDLNGDQDGDQTTDNPMADWLLPVGIADLCDNDCNSLIATTVTRAQYHSSETGHCTDGVDNNCNGQFDCADPSCASDPACCTNECTATGLRECRGASTYRQCTTDTNNCRVWGVDQTCPGTETCAGAGICTPPIPPCHDTDQDGYSLEGGGSCCGPLHNATCGTSIDCNDNNPLMHPGLTETCDGYDNNCNNQVDEGCDKDGDDYCYDGMTYYPNWTGAPPYPGIGLNPCPNTTGNNNNTKDCNDTPASGVTIHPGATELCNNIDDNCDGQVDNGVAVSGTCPLTQGVCATAIRTCVTGTWQCNYGTNYQATETNCTDGFDNDCDGLTDGGDTTDCVTTCTFPFPFPCTFP